MQMNPKGALDCCCYRYQIPVELRHVIFTLYYQITDPFVDQTPRDAVQLWTGSPSQRRRAYLKYGHISWWNTSQVHDMAHLFMMYETFNGDIEN